MNAPCHTWYMNYSIWTEQIFKLLGNQGFLIYQLIKCCIAYFSVISSRKILSPLQLLAFHGDNSEFVFWFSCFAIICILDEKKPFWYLFEFEFFREIISFVSNLVKEYCMWGKFYQIRVFFTFHPYRWII